MLAAVFKLLVFTFDLSIEGSFVSEWATIRLYYIKIVHLCISIAGMTLSICAYDHVLGIATKHI